MLLRTVLDGKRQQGKLAPKMIAEEIIKHRMTILQGSKYNLKDQAEYEAHFRLVRSIGDNYMLRELSNFQIDEHNANVIKFLIYYFNSCELAESVFPDEHYKIHKNILLIGEPGTGKTMLMQIFSDYLKITKNDSYFRNISITQLMNYYKIHGHIDKYTYNENANAKSFEGAPVNVCLNDLGLMTENQKSYGTTLTQVTDEFLFARYEIYQQQGRKYHITSNLSVRNLKDRFEERLIDRFKSFNVVELRGGSRRR